MGGDPIDKSSEGMPDVVPGRAAAPRDVAVVKALSYLQPSQRKTEGDPTEEWISDMGVSRAPVDRHHKPAAQPLSRGLSLYHSTILSRAHAIDMDGFDDDLDASVSLWYTDSGEQGPLFEERLPLLPEGLPAELRGAFVEIRIPNLEAVGPYIAHPEHEATNGQSQRFIIPSAVANGFPRRVVTHGGAQTPPQRSDGKNGKRGKLGKLWGR
jgi:hypothetical protein